MDLELIIILASIAVVGVIAVKVVWLLKLTKKPDAEESQDP